MVVLPVSTAFTKRELTTRTIATVPLPQRLLIAQLPMPMCVPNRNDAQSCTEFSSNISVSAEICANGKDLTGTVYSEPGCTGDSTTSALFTTGECVGEDDDTLSGSKEWACLNAEADKNDDDDANVGFWSIGWHVAVVAIAGATVIAGAVCTIRRCCRTSSASAEHDPEADYAALQNE